MSGQSASSHLKVLFETALQDYEWQTGIALANHPLAKRLQECDSVESITAVFPVKFISIVMFSTQRSLQSLFIVQIKISQIRQCGRVALTTSFVGVVQVRSSGAPNIDYMNSQFSTLTLVVVDI
jgi:hypothetical protein